MFRKRREAKKIAILHMCIKVSSMCSVPEGHVVLLLSWSR